MNKLEMASYGFGLTIIILLIVAIFAFSYNSSIEKEYFSNYVKYNDLFLSL